MADSTNNLAAINNDEDKTPANKLAPDELERKEKKFLEELESLRTEEKALAQEFNLEFKENIFIDHWDENFSYKENLKRVLAELSQTEDQLFQKRSEFDQTKVNQTLSRLRILREKVQTVFDRYQN